MGRVAQSL